MYIASLLVTVFIFVLFFIYSLYVAIFYKDLFVNKILKLETLSSANFSVYSSRSSHVINRSESCRILRFWDRRQAEAKGGKRRRVFRRQEEASGGTTGFANPVVTNSVPKSTS